MRFVDLGLISFEAALRIQQQTVAEVARAGAPETVYLLEHPPVYTLGRRGNEKHLIDPIDGDGRPLRLVRTNRGGDVTYHGPGQLVGYLHLKLETRGRDLHRFLRDLEEVLIETVGAFGVQAYRRSGLTGIWTDSGKLASIGVGVRRWVSMHGFALNVHTDLNYFKKIKPCGLDDCRMVSLQSLLPDPPLMPAVKERFQTCCRQVFAPDSALRARKFQ